MEGEEGGSSYKLKPSTLTTSGVDGIKSRRETRHEMLILNWWKYWVWEMGKFVCGGSTEMQLMFLKAWVEYKGLWSKKVRLVDTSNPQEAS